MGDSSHIRDYPQLVEDVLWPASGGVSGPPPDRRHLALYDVLCRMPAPDYAELATLIDSSHWYIPPAHSGAEVRPFPGCVEIEEGLAPCAVVLFLSPVMERWGADVVVAAVAHELAHLVLRHKLMGRQDELEAQESEAWSLVRAWGFEREEKAHEAFYKRRARREARMIERLWRS